MTATIRARLIGGPTLQFSYAGLNVLTDPTFDPPGEHPGGIPLFKTAGPAVPASDVLPVDLVLLSHDQHSDNLDRAGRELLAEAPIVLSTPAAAERIAGVTGLEPWQDATVGEVRITAVPALHGPAGAEELSGIVTGFVLRAPGWPVTYVSGDNASVELVQQIVDRHGPFDVAVLHAGAANVGRFGDLDLTLNALTAVQAARVLGDARIVAVHTLDWEHFSETPERLQRQFERAGLADRLTLPTRGAWFEVG